MLATWKCSNLLSLLYIKKSPQIRLQVGRAVRRPTTSSSQEFSDRNMLDARDGYVACESAPPAAAQASPPPHGKEGDGGGAPVVLMDRSVQAVPTVREDASQTELKHPKSVALQYEARVFSQEEVAELWKSPEMKSFLRKAEDM